MNYVTMGPNSLYYAVMTDTGFCQVVRMEPLDTVIEMQAVGIPKFCYDSTTLNEYPLVAIMNDE